MPNHKEEYQNLIDCFNCIATTLENTTDPKVYDMLIVDVIELNGRMIAYRDDAKMLIKERN